MSSNNEAQAQHLTPNPQVPFPLGLIRPPFRAASGNKTLPIKADSDRGWLSCKPHGSVNSPIRVLFKTGPGGLGRLCSDLFLMRSRRCKNIPASHVAASPHKGLENTILIVILNGQMERCDWSGGVIYIQESRGGVMGLEPYNRILSPGHEIRT